jgi:hypothetical protein
LYSAESHELMVPRGLLALLASALALLRTGELRTGDNWELKGGEDWDLVERSWLLKAEYFGAMGDIMGESGVDGADIWGGRGGASLVLGMRVAGARAAEEVAEVALLEVGNERSMTSRRALLRGVVAGLGRGCMRRGIGKAVSKCRNGRRPDCALLFFRKLNLC